MKYFRFAIVIALAAVGTILFSACGTTGVRALPAYEPPLVKSGFQTVRTTAYTHTESDHLQFTDHNALGGQLQAAGPPIHRAENTRLLEIDGDYRVVSYTPAPQPLSGVEATRVSAPPAPMLYWVMTVAPPALVL